MWRLKWSDLENCRPQRWHLNGFWPEIKKITNVFLQGNWFLLNIFECCSDSGLTCVFPVMPCKLVRPRKLPGTPLPRTLVRLLTGVGPSKYCLQHLSPPRLVAKITNLTEFHLRNLILGSAGFMKIAGFNVAKNWTPVFQDCLRDKLCSFKKCKITIFKSSWYFWSN